jgi:hypothetical protein
MPFTIKTKGWVVSYCGTQVLFDTRAQAKRFIRDKQKDVVDRRGGTFKAAIVRIAIGSEATS